MYEFLPENIKRRPFDERPLLNPGKITQSKWRLAGWIGAVPIQLAVFCTWSLPLYITLALDMWC